MKVITLNTWGGRVSEPIKKFFADNQNIDIFCLQEVYKNAHEKEESAEYQNDMLDFFHEINQYIPNHTGLFAPQIHDHYGLAMFVKNELKISNQGDVFVYKHKGYIPDGDLGFHARNLQYVTIEHNNQKNSLLNFHGLWTGKGKLDNDDRIKQSQNIIAFCEKIDHPYVLCGDFNLEPDTESIKILEGFGLKNLVKEYGITSTRTSFYTKSGKFADYIFTSPEIIVKDFKVLPDEVSDHAPLYIEL